MPLLRRDDGVTFVLQPYRETLTIKNTALLRKEIRYLGDAHGNFARLFKRVTGEYEAVFSQEAGYLFGETVWNHFEQPHDLIYCEVLSEEEQQALLVIVREGKVYLDTKLTFEHLKDEIAGLLAANAGYYEVYIYGAIPVNFTSTNVKSVTELPVSLFKQIAIDEKFQLYHLERALDEYNLSLKQRSSFIVFIVVISLLVLGVLWWHAAQQQTTVQVNPYEQYELALSTPDPGQQIDALVKKLAQIDNISGWYADSFNYNGQVAEVTMHSLGGTATGLMSSTQQLNMQSNFSAQGAKIDFTTILTGRPSPDRILDSQQVIALIIDRMMQILPGKAVEINNSAQNDVFAKTDITISFSNISPEILQLIGTNLNDLPVSLTSCNATIEKGLFSGSLQLAVVGK